MTGEGKVEKINLCQPAKARKRGERKSPGFACILHEKTSNFPGAIQPIQVWIRPAFKKVSFSPPPM
jgi:hypothetical protein